MTVLLLLALLGHAFLWVTMINRLHGTGAKGFLRYGPTLLGFIALVAIPIGYAYALVDQEWTLFALGGMVRLSWPARAYLGLCWIGAAITSAGWFWRHVLRRTPDVLHYHRTHLVDFPSLLAGSDAGEDEHHFLVRLPGNQILQLDVAERAFEVPRLPKGLDRLSVMHISDFHFTGRVGKSYFQEVTRLSNGFQPDLLLVTGDLVDDSAYLDWVPETFGKMTSRFGAFFVLGNHDRKIDHRRLRKVLVEHGWTDLGGRWLELAVRGEPVILAGNELPWFRPAADLASAPPRQADGRPLRIALAHSPDQLAWAQAHDVDLLLAGHTHGGQIRLPLVGPIFAPCRAGVKYAWGLYHAPPTVMHVTRGVSGEFPVRMNCPPEMVHLVLRASGHG
jgi:predicted MPP superfamily phosphohydrolase